MKTKVTHTPGPWAVQCQGRNEPIYILGPEPKNTFIANLCSDLRWDDSFANANLIVAAPDLLEVAEWILENAVDRGETVDENTEQEYEEWQALRNAITKAKGSAPEK